MFRASALLHQQHAQFLFRGGTEACCGSGTNITAVEYSKITLIIVARDEPGGNRYCIKKINAQQNDRINKTKHSTKI